MYIECFTTTVQNLIGYLDILMLGVFILIINLRDMLLKHYHILANCFFFTSCTDTEKREIK